MTRDMKAILTLLTAQVVLCALALAGVAYGKASAVRRVLDSMPVHVTDKGEAPEKRGARLDAISAAIEGATQVPIERAALLVLARRESGLAAYVFEHRCSDGPRGERECDSGKAKGVFQLQPNRMHPEIPADVASQAKIAIAAWRYGMHRCSHSVPDDIAGAFDSYGSGGGCAPTEQGKSRAAETRAYAGRL